MRRNRAATAREAAEASADRFARARPREPEFLASTRPFKDALQRNAKRGYVKLAFTKGAAVLIKSPQMVVEAYFAAVVSESQRKKVAYKMPLILSKLCDVERDARGRVTFYGASDAARGEQESGAVLLQGF
jgi:hypothetical protein